MAATAEVKIVTAFADDSQRDIKFGPFTASDSLVSAIKTRVKAFDPTTVQGLYLSDAGATCTRIAAASVTETEIETINLNDVEEEEEGE